VDPIVDLLLEGYSKDLAWFLVPHEDVPANVLMLARAIAVEIHRAAELPLDEDQLLTELVQRAVGSVVWRGDVDASERAEWQHERVQDLWNELLSHRAIAEQETTTS